MMALNPIAELNIVKSTFGGTFEESCQCKYRILHTNFIFSC